MVYAMDDFAGRLTAAMTARGIGVRALARRIHCDPALISRLAAGKQNPSPKIAQLLDDALGTGGTLPGSPLSTPPAAAQPEVALEDELAAIEVSRRASSTSVGEVTVGRLEKPLTTSRSRIRTWPPGYSSSGSAATSITQPGFSTGR